MKSIDVSDAPELRLIVGPTGAGKSALALALAVQHGARILSGDSRQIYRGFDIGTAKPTREEQRRVPHFGIDVADPTERWSAAQWAREAEGWMAAARAANTPVIVVGGTGLWLDALVRPLAAVPAIDPAARTALHAELAMLDTPTLRARVEELDPARAHLGRTQLLRAAESAILGGVRLSDLHEQSPRRLQFNARWLVVDPGPVLAAKLDARRTTMVESGWVEEVERLSATVAHDAPAWNACGYREIREAVQGRQTLEHALEHVRIRTRQYAKRQRTWFRNQLQAVGPVSRLDPNTARALERADHWFTDGVLA